MNGAAGDAASVLAALSRHGVRWCLWRGSVRVERAFAGDSDFDLLVDAAQADDLEAALIASGCRRGCSRRPEAGLADWFGLASPTGPLLHYHVHFAMVAGEPRCNRFLLPWARAVLAGRRYRDDARGPLFVADPVHECALLLLRCSLQLRGRDRWLGGAAGRLLAKVRGDFQALAPDGGIAAVGACLEGWLGRAVSLPSAGPAAIERTDLWRLRAHARAALAPFTSVRGIAAVGAIWCGDARAAWHGLARRRRWVRTAARTGRSGGLLIALCSVDASARRRVADTVQRLLTPKFDVLTLPYDGRGSAPAVRARTRGMLVLGEMAAPPAAAHPVVPVAAMGTDADAVVAVDAAGALDAQVADTLRAIWQRL